MVAHVAFSPFDNYKRCMAAPLTEVTLIKVKDGADIQEFKAASENGLDKAGAAEGCIRGAWGFTVEDEKMIVMVMGWESNEVSRQYSPYYSLGREVTNSTQAYLKYEDSETFKNVIIRYEKVAELVKLSHVRLTLK